MFLDVSGLISAGGERGLLGLASCIEESTVVKIKKDGSCRCGDLRLTDNPATRSSLSHLAPGRRPALVVGFAASAVIFLSVHEYADYSMGNHGLSPAEQRRQLRGRRIKSLLFGAGVTVMMLIPVLQFAAMPAAVAGATRLWVDDLSGGRQ